MFWERKKAYIPVVPVPPQAKSWLLATIIAVVFSVLLFVLHASDKLYFLQNINIWIVTIIPIIFLVVIFCVRSYLFGRSLSECVFLQDEANTAQNQWQHWAERYMAVVAHTILLPDKISALFLMGNTKDFPSQNNLIKYIDYLPDQHSVEFQSISLLMKSIAEQLNALSPEIALNVTILTDAAPDEYPLLRTNFLDCWDEIFPTGSAPENINLETALPYDVIDSKLKCLLPVADLLLILQQQGEDKYSDGLGVFLFTTDDVAQKYQLPVKGRLLRPMTAETDAFSADLTLFMENQVLSQKAQGILADSQLFTSLIASIFPTVAVLGTELTPDNILIQERFTGIPGPFSAWLTVGLGLDLALQCSSPYLVFARAEQYWFISTVSSGSYHEIV